MLFRSDVRAHVGPATDVLDGAGATVVPGLVDTHIHPFHGTEATRGLDLRAARTLDDVRGLLAAERARCGPDTWILAHSVRYEPFHASGIRADAIADAIGESPAILGFYDGVAFGLQYFRQKSARAFIIIDDKNMFHEVCQTIIFWE